MGKKPKKMIQCKACGAEIAKSAKACPKCGAKNKKKHPILAIVLALIIVIIFVSCLGDNDEPKVVESSTNNTQVSNTQTSSAQPETAKEEKTRFDVGEKVEMSNISVTLVDVSENSGKTFFEPTDGNVFLVCEFLIENNSGSDISVSSLLSFEAYIDDFSTTLDFSALASTDKTQLDGSVAAGKKMQGVVGYQVPSDWSELEIRFTPDFWSGKEFVFVASR